MSHVGLLARVRQDCEDTKRQSLLPLGMHHSCKSHVGTASLQNCTTPSWFAFPRILSITKNIPMPLFSLIKIALFPGLTAIKSTHCSCRGLAFGSQDPLGSHLPSPVTLVPEADFWPALVLITRRVQANTHTRESILTMVSHDFLSVPQEMHILSLGRKDTVPNGAPFSREP